MKYEDYIDEIENPKGLYIPIAFKLYKSRNTRCAARDIFWDLADMLLPKTVKGEPNFSDSKANSSLIIKTYSALKKRNDIDKSKISIKEFKARETEKEEAEKLLRAAMEIKEREEAARIKREQEEAAQLEYDRIHGRQGSLGF